jgi:hypothetical protein
MTRANDVALSPDEIVATLRNSTLPTLLVEGRSDMEFFHALEDMCFGNRIDIMPTGGRLALFKVFKRRAEFRTTPVAFLADSDMFIFGNVPPDLSGIIFTEGYAIENDILSGGKHRAKWAKVISALSQWFGAAAHRYLNGETVDYSQHPGQLVCFSAGTLTPLAQAVLIDPEPLCEQAKRVLAEPTKYLRGHTLLDALGHFLATAKQPPKCSKDVLLRMDLVSWETNRPLQRIVSSVQTAIPQLTTNYLSEPQRIRMCRSSG